MSTPRPIGAIVLLDGRAPDRAALDAAWPGWDADHRFVVAADGGARLAAGLGLRVDHWVGDGDSLGPAAIADLERDGVVVDLRPMDKDATDGELAVALAVGLGATTITLLGALGGPRVDQELGNLGLLAGALGSPAIRPAAPGAAAVNLVIVDPTARLRLLAGPAVARLAGRAGDLVSLVPWGTAVHGVTTTGLHYPLADESLAFGPTRGISNVRAEPEATVAIRDGVLLVVEVPATLAG